MYSVYMGLSKETIKRQLKAQQEWRKENMRYFQMGLSRNKDGELLRYIESKPSANAWIRKACIHQMEIEKENPLLFNDEKDQG